MVDITDVMDEDYATPPPPHIAEGIEEGNFPPQDAWGGSKQSTDDRSRELIDDADDIDGAMEHAIRPSARLRRRASSPSSARRARRCWRSAPTPPPPRPLLLLLRGPHPHHDDPDGRGREGRAPPPLRIGGDDAKTLSRPQRHDHID